MTARRKNQIRVISGSLKGRLLDYPAERILRPTMQRTKSSIFESLGDRVRGAVFVDLYAAAGGIGIEALSRGAAVVHFVELHRTALQLLRGNLERCRIDPEQGRVHAQDVSGFLDLLSDIKPDLVYADPPYGSGDATVLLEFFSRIEYPFIEMLILEHEKELSTMEFDRLLCTRTKSFGQTCVSFFVPDGRNPT